MVSESAKRQQFQKKKSFSDVENPEVTANMVGSSFTPSKSKEKQLAVSSKESDVDRSPDFKDVLIKPEGSTNTLGLAREHHPSRL